MPEIKNIFTAGRMNKSLDERGIPKNEYRHAENIQVNSTDGADIGAVQNLLGNSLIQNETNFTNPHFKGGVVDSTSNKIYWFVKDDNGSYMLSFDEVNVSFLIKDIGNTAFNFDNNLITGITLFEDHVVLTDNINEPYIIDLNYFTSDKVRFDPATDNTQVLYDATWLDLSTDDITVIKKKPKSALNIGFVEKTIETDKALFEDKFVRFAYRWKFENGQYSAFSPFSTVAFNPGPDNSYDIEEGYNLQMLNNIVQINISNFEKTNGVEFIDILYKESNNNNVYVYKTIPATDITDSATEISLTKESIYSIVPSDQLLRQYDNVPQKAKAVENIANRLVFGNYTDGLDLKGYSPSFTITTQNRTENTFQSIKSGRNYQFGVLFEDKYGRQTPVISNDTGSYFRDFNDLGAGKEFAISLNDLPEETDQIARFKYYVKSTEQEFYNIIVSEAYNDVDAPDDFIWLVIPSYEVNKLQEEDFIILKKAANSSVALNNPDLKYKVLDIQSSKPEKLAPNKTFPDKFFVKLKKDAFLTDALLSQQGLGGDSGIINEEDFQYGTSGMSSSPLEIYYFDYQGTRTKYLYQDGKIYEDDTQQVPEESVEVEPPVDTMTDGTSCVGSDADWKHVQSGINFTDSLGNVITDVYVRINVSVPYALDFAICVQGSTSSSESNPAIFETIPDNDLLDIYYETEESYPINEIDQEKTIQWFNCFDLGNGVESNRIRDDFNESTIDKQVRVSTTIAEQFKQRVNKSGLIWSGLFNSRSSINRLNQFSTGMPITKDLNPEYGSIQLLHTRDTDLITFCEDKVLRILANKDALYNADGSTNITASNAVLGQAMPYNGEFGISTNPESFAYYGYQAYFTDKARGAVLRLSKDGITLISSKGMASYFRDAMIDLNGPILGSYDIHSKQYILSLTGVNKTLGFSESSDGWTSFFTFTPEFGCYLDGKYYTFNKSKIWRHHANNSRNTFYNITKPSKLTFIFNDQPSAVKKFKTLSYEGTKDWIAESIETDLQSGSVITFKDKEGKWFNNIKGTVSALAQDGTIGTLDSKEFSTQGIGYMSTLITPVVPTIPPVAPTIPPVAPTIPPVVPTIPPIAPTPVAPTPVAPTPVAPTPVVPSTPPSPPTGDFTIINNSGAAINDFYAYLDPSGTAQFVGTFPINDGETGSFDHPAAAYRGTEVVLSTTSDRVLEVYVNGSFLAYSWSLGVSSISYLSQIHLGRNFVDTDQIVYKINYYKEYAVDTTYNNGSATLEGACASPLTNDIYSTANSLVEAVQIGQQFWDNKTGSWFQGQNEWYSIGNASDSNGTYAVQLDSTGIVIDSVVCPPETPQTYEYRIDVNETLGATNSQDGCGNILNISVYSEWPTLEQAVEVGAVIFDSNNWPDGFNGDFKWYSIGTTSDLDGIYSVLLSNTGTIQQVVDCTINPIPPTPPTYYYQATNCEDSNDVITIYSVGQSVVIGKIYGNGPVIGDGCYQILSTGGSDGFNIADFTEYNDCVSCTGETPTVPTPPTPVTPTTPDVFYTLKRCSDGSTGWRTQQTTSELTLSVDPDGNTGSRVEGSGPTIYTVIGTATAGTNIGIVSNIPGEQGCPTSPTVPTPPTYNYYAVDCSNPSNYITVYSTGSTLGIGNVYGDGPEAGCWTIDSISEIGGLYNISSFSSYIDCEVCSGPPPTPTTPPTAPAPACQVNVAATTGLLDICGADEIYDTYATNLGACDMCSFTYIQGDWITSIAASNSIFYVKYNNKYGTFKRDGGGNIAYAVSGGDSGYFNPNPGCITCSAPTPPTPTTPPVTPTPPVTYYQLSGCQSQGTYYTTSQGTQGGLFQSDSDGTFLYTGSNYNYLPGSEISGYFTGSYGCPAPPAAPTPPTPTTPPPVVPTGPTLYYYILQNCANSAQLQYAYSTDPNITNGDTFSYFGNCYTYYDIDPSQQGSIDLDPLSPCSCNPPTPTPIPAAPVVYEYRIHTFERTGTNSNTSACGQQTSIAVWTDYTSLEASVGVGSVWYVDQNLNPFDGDFKWYGVSRTDQLDSTYSVLLSNAGTVQQVYDCSTPPPVAPTPPPVAPSPTYNSWETTDCSTGNVTNRVPYDESYSIGSTSVKLNSGCALIGFPSELSAEEIPSNVYGSCSTCNSDNPPPVAPTTPPVAPTPIPNPPAPAPVVCSQYYIVNTTGVGLSVTFTSTNCTTGATETRTIAPDGYELICSSTEPVATTNGEYGEVTYEGNCGDPATPPPPPVAPTPPTPPADNVFTVERSSDGFATYAQLVQGYYVNDLVELDSDGLGVCYEIMGTAYVLTPGDWPSIVGACTPPPPPVAPTPPPAPTCYPMSLSKNTTSASACTEATRTYYLDTDRLDTANVVYSNSGCTAGVFQSAGYFSDGLQVRYWNGSSLGPVEFCSF